MKNPRFATAVFLFLVIGTFWSPGAGQAANSAELSAGNTDFAFKLYANVRSQDGNLFFSPFSLSTALAMTFAGARGPTAEEMGRTLCLPEHTKVHPLFKDLLAAIDGTGKPYRLHVANALWGQKGGGFLPAFLDGVKAHYGAGLEELDFVGDAETARKTINTWVAGKTANQIPDLIPAGILGPLTRLVLTNAIYFKGTWITQFKPEATQDADFFTQPDRPVKTPLMHLEQTLPYYRGERFAALELPYAGDELSMVVMLPDAKDGIGAFEQGLDRARWEAVLAGLCADGKVRVWLPRFKVTQSLMLKDTLTAMGMPLAFSDNADFSGMNGKTDLKIGAVIHQAYADVNEEGTEAAAATAVEMTRKSISEDEPPEFRADHPFVFAIRHKVTGSILFLGRLSDPTR